MRTRPMRTLVFLEGVASRSPHGSAMCDYDSLDSSCVLLWKDTSLAKREC
jgi:hypothetical protein